jgi:hypothetical protein
MNKLFQEFSLIEIIQFLNMNDIYNLFFINKHIYNILLSINIFKLKIKYLFYNTTNFYNTSYEEYPFDNNIIFTHFYKHKQIFNNLCFYKNKNNTIIPNNIKYCFLLNSLPIFENYNNIISFYIINHKQSTNLININKFNNLEFLYASYLELNQISNLNLKCLYLDYCNQILSISNLPKLKVLWLYNCTNFKIIQNLPNLQKLKIYDCNQLKNISNLPNLQKLKIYYCNQLKNISNLPNLQKLVIYNCNNIKNIQNLPNLQILYINNCNNIKNIPNLPNLQILDITE